MSGSSVAFWIIFIMAAAFLVAFALNEIHIAILKRKLRKEVKDFLMTRRIDK